MGKFSKTHISMPSYGKSKRMGTHFKNVCHPQMEYACRLKASLWTHDTGGPYIYNIQNPHKRRSLGEFRLVFGAGGLPIQVVPYAGWLISCDATTRVSQLTPPGKMTSLEGHV